MSGYGDQVLFARRAAYEATGGFEAVPLFEDVRFFRRLHGMGRLKVLPLQVTSSARRFRESGVLRQMMTNVRLAHAHRWGAEPVALALLYEGKAGSAS